MPSEISRRGNRGLREVIPKDGIAVAGVEATKTVKENTLLRPAACTQGVIVDGFGRPRSSTDNKGRNLKGFDRLVKNQEAHSDERTSVRAI
jgi:hypothetical protein